MDTQLGMLVRKTRHLRGLTLEEVAEQIGVTTGALSHIESGRRLPSPSNAVAIAGVLGIPEEDILQALDTAHSQRRRSSLDRSDSWLESPSLEPGPPRPSAKAYSAQPIEALFEEPGRPRASTRRSSGEYSRLSLSPSASMRDMARWSGDAGERVAALNQLADSASDAIRTLRGLIDDEDPTISREARRLLRELDVRMPEE